MSNELNAVAELTGNARVAFDRMYDSLPYDWFRDDSTNIAKVLALFAVHFGEVKDILDQFPKTRDLDQATDNALDLLGKTYAGERMLYRRPDGTTVREPDENYRDRIKWHIFIQESWGNIQQIKEITAWWLRVFRRDQGFGGVVISPWLTVSQWDDSAGQPKPTYTTPHNSDPANLVDITKNEIQVWRNEDPMTGQKAPVDTHPRYGGLHAFFVVGIPWPAVPLSPNQNALIFQDENIYADPSALPDDPIHGWGSGVWNAVEKTILLDELLQAMTISKAAGVEARPYGTGGFIWQDQNSFADLANLPDDPLHGWNRGQLDGDLAITLDAMNRFGPAFWEEG